MADADDSLALRAAWLHFVGGMTQSAVAKRLGLPSVKAHRLIAKAVADGAVKVSIDGDITECIDLENRLADMYGLDYCEVAPDIGEEGLPLMVLGHAGADFLRREIEHGDHEVIGIGHGRTLSAAVSYMPRVAASNVRFVSLLGGLTRNFAANPHDVMHRIAEKTGMPAYVMPVPFFANTAEDREVLLAQRGVTTVFDMGCRAELKIVGIGTVDAQAQLVTSGMIELSEVEEIANLGGVGEMLGHFFDANGQRLETALTARTIAASVENADMSRIIGLAGGISKADAIRAVLKSGRLYGLITDERTARALIRQPDGK
ncbi:sugar-binding transcriptional regulator [Brucella intermedia]|uniref:DNA-binding transcriptional regulator LsrR (DeoR family) n=6 Tax=Brucella/Ochrobactrum group TaxID=2826938 RepID=A0ABR6ALM3_9HYPH|nr:MULTISPECIES: sugar-binding transcriptional regulator [Brucella/Ochrobactrum group]ERI12280.1 ERI operon repressor [Ochrobactrum sp. EGD-AQ16]KAB2670265.1 sugar-binding transcriptional regulator [Ochrobactrum sp. LMG 5442]PJR91872.1 DNA-binding transcriptional regulator [Ochrobactrum sp. 721/2009]PJT14933.1 DNA-binding transcriptional regulator [Ochrobactrum sp. 720/2009]PJT19412.1 DNA-binding transcriptional regulator [Ochrobactrum sp. 30A/1000/2015]PJT20233.1 DNA-binding transcriptional 